MGRGFREGTGGGGIGGRGKREVGLREGLELRVQKDHGDKEDREDKRRSKERV